MEDRIDVIWEAVNRTGSQVTPGVNSVAANYLQGYQDLVNRKMGPWQAFTITRTQTYTETSSFFGLIKRQEWLDRPRVFTPVETGPAAGFFFSPESAAKAAKEALKVQLRGGPP